MWKIATDGGGMRPWFVINLDTNRVARDKGGKERRWGDHRKAQALADALNKEGAQ
jgi:hypothetical protein